MSQVFTPFGFQQSTGRMTPTVIGPGMAPNVGTPVDPRSLSYYGDYYEENLYPAANSGYNAPRFIYNVTFGPADIPRTSDAISVKLNGTNSIAVRWDGEPRAIKSMTFSVLGACPGINLLSPESHFVSRW